MPKVGDKERATQTRLVNLFQQALYDNFDQNEDLVNDIDAAVNSSRKDGWKGNRFKTRKAAAK